MTPYFESRLWEWTNCGMTVHTWRLVMAAIVVLLQIFIILWLGRLLFRKATKKGTND
jgi:ABC-type sugar transport system permease subunit